MGYIAFGQIPDAMSFAGYTVIIAMAIVVFVYNRRHATLLSDIPDIFIAPLTVIVLPF